ncbi:hypothetical protein PSEWESI4_04814 [Pseudomonas carbonaria]|uniref:Uncharacterized protein n=1 Tax=Zestomonas carbonaria TaxID=2762745 RepID=A0A7U7ET09_9GAMM|nr:hypothetical protein PSEWESI4_04814 [Pseudomonas carbonaria]
MPAMLFAAMGRSYGRERSSQVEETRRFWIK